MNQQWNELVPSYPTLTEYGRNNPETRVRINFQITKKHVSITFFRSLKIEWFKRVPVIFLGVFLFVKKAHITC